MYKNSRSIDNLRAVRYDIRNPDLVAFHVKSSDRIKLRFVPSEMRVFPNLLFIRNMKHLNSLYLLSNKNKKYIRMILLTNFSQTSNITLLLISF